MVATSKVSTIYKRNRIWWYSRGSNHSSDHIQISLGVTQKWQATELQKELDLEYARKNLGLAPKKHILYSDCVARYIKSLENRGKSYDTIQLASRVLNRRFEPLSNVIYVADITLEVLDDFIAELSKEISNKTIKEYIGVIRRFLEYARKRKYITENVAMDLEGIETEPVRIYRNLTDGDLKILLTDKTYGRYYTWLYLTGLRAGDVIMLKSNNINQDKQAIVGFIRKSRRIHEFPIHSELLKDVPNSGPVFPGLYAEKQWQIKDKIKTARLRMQEILKENKRPHAVLHSFRVRFNNSLRDLGLSDKDRAVLLAHANTQTVEVYTHPNFDLAKNYVNRLELPVKL